MWQKDTDTAKALDADTDKYTGYIWHALMLPIEIAISQRQNTICICFPYYYKYAGTQIREYIYYMAVYKAQHLLPAAASDIFRAT